MTTTTHPAITAVNVAYAAKNQNGGNPLWTDRMQAQIPPGNEDIAYYRYFANAGEWYVLDAHREDDDVVFFGYVHLYSMPECAELGDFLLSDLKQHIKGIELEKYFTPTLNSTYYRSHS